MITWKDRQDNLLGVNYYCLYKRQRGSELIQWCEDERIKTFMKDMSDGESIGKKWRRKGLRGERKKSEVILWDIECPRRSGEREVVRKWHLDYQY